MKVEIKGIKKRFGKKRILEDITLTACEGECIGILGGNGSGKSTLLSILAKIQDADGGEFILDGVNLIKNKKIHASAVGYVPQGTPLIEELTAKDNLLMWYSGKELSAELESGSLKFLQIDGFLNTTVKKMSGGMKKRLSIGCALKKNPKIMLLDEPTASLDIPCKQKIAQWVKWFKKEGGIVFLATHDVMELDLCDRWFIIKEGRLEPFEYDGDMEKLVRCL